MSPLVEVRSAGFAGNGCFASGFARAGTPLLEAAKPLVWAVNDSLEDRNCRQCLQPCGQEGALLSPPPAAPARGGDDGDRETIFSPSSSSPPPPPPPPLRDGHLCCPICMRSVLCEACAAVATAGNGTAAAAAAGSEVASPSNGMAESGAVVAAVVGGASPHDRLECETLVRLSALQLEQPGLTGSLLGGSTVYLRLLLRLLAMRASMVSTKQPQPRQQQTLSNIDELEDHLEDLLDSDGGGGEMEARMVNTIKAARLVAPASWKASQDTCAEYLGKLYCNSMTVGRVGFSAPLARRRYWSGIRGSLYSDFGVGLFPEGAMFNHSCSPNCWWRTDASGALEVVAVEDVEPGSQLFISYVDILQPRPVRRDLLRQHFFFDCTCQRCSGGDTPRQDERTAGTPGTWDGRGGEDGEAEAQEQKDEDEGGGGRMRAAARGGSCPTGVSGSGGGRGGGEAEELVCGGWVCPRRSCAGSRGRMLPPLPNNTASGGGGGGGGDGAGGIDGEIGGNEGDVKNGAEGWKGLGVTGTGIEEGALPRRRCNRCGVVADEAYFGRWTNLLNARRSAADRHLSSGRVREGRQKLAELQKLCERRLATCHAFTFGILCRLSLAAAADEDWPATAAHAERALICMRGLLTGITGGGGGGDGGRESGSRASGGGEHDGHVGGLGVSGVGGNGGGRGGDGPSSGRNVSARGRKCGRDSEKSGDSADNGGSDERMRVTTGLPPGCPVHATDIWEAMIVEVLDRALPLAGRGYERNTESHRALVTSADRACAAFGLRRGSLVTL